MKAGFKARAEQLWHDARPWRYTVLAAGLFTFLAVLNAVTGPSSATMPAAPFLVSTPAMPPLDPAIEARLVAFDIAAADAGKRTGRVDRCEHLAVAFTALSKDDVTAGRNVVRSSKSRIDALRSGQECQDDLAASDKRLTALERAVASLSPKSIGSWCPAISASYGSLTEMDRARTGRAAEIVAKTAGIAESCAASDARLSALLEALSAARTDQGAIPAQRVAEALRLLSDDDRARLSASRKADLESADRIAAAVGRSRSRIAALPGLVSALKDDPETVMALLKALDEVTTFDRNLATPSQAAAIDEAWNRVTMPAWGLLKNKLAQLKTDPSLRNYRATAALYAAIQHDTGHRSGEQDALLHDGAEATRFLANSDAKLQQLAGSLNAWREQRFAARDQVLFALGAVSDFERNRFDPAEAATYQELSRAALILRGPQIGLSNAPDTRTAIYVFTTGNLPADRDLVTAFREAFRRVGYQVVNTRSDAALLVEASIRSIGQPQLSTASGPIGQYTVDAEIAVDAWWASDDTRLFTGAATGSGLGGYSMAQTEAIRAARETAISRIVGQGAR